MVFKASRTQQFWINLEEVSKYYVFAVDKEAISLEELLKVNSIATIEALNI